MARKRKYNYKAIYSDYLKLKDKDKYPRHKKEIADKYNTSRQMINYIIKVFPKKN